MNRASKTIFNIYNTVEYDESAHNRNIGCSITWDDVDIAHVQYEEWKAYSQSNSKSHGLASDL